MSKSIKVKFFLILNFVLLFSLIFVLSACNSINFNISDLNDKIKKEIKKNFNNNFTRSVYDSAIVSYGTKFKNSKVLNHLFCKYDEISDNVSINGTVLLSYLPGKSLFIDSIGKKDGNYVFRCYFHNINKESGKYQDFYAYINFSMSDVDFKSVNVDFFSDFKE